MLQIDDVSHNGGANTMELNRIALFKGSNSINPFGKGAGKTDAILLFISDKDGSVSACGNDARNFDMSHCQCVFPQIRVHCGIIGGIAGKRNGILHVCTGVLCAANQ